MERGTGVSLPTLAIQGREREGMGACACMGRRRGDVRGVVPVGVRRIVRAIHLVDEDRLNAVGFGWTFVRGAHVGFEVYLDLVEADGA